MANYDVLVIGGGIVGAATAYFAARAGLQPLLLEKREALGLLTTAASLAAFRAQFGEPENIAMMRESIAFFENIRAETGIPDADIGLTQQGYLFCTTTAEGAAAAQKRVALQHSCGLTDVELWNGDETRAHFPYISDEVIAATFRARDGWLSPNDLTNLYGRASRAKILYETEVTDLLLKDDQVQGVQSSRGKFYAPLVVLAAGPFTKPFAARYGLELPINLIRRQHAAIKEHALIPHDAPMTIDSDTGAHWRPEGRGAIVATNTPELPGEPLDRVQPDWEFPAIALDAVSRISPFWLDVADTLRKGDLDVRAGQYDMTPDAKPIIDAHPHLRGLYIHCGYSGHGVMGSTAGSRMLADLMTGKLARADNPFSMARLENLDASSLEKMVI